MASGKKPFQVEVPGKYGAPMGRRSDPLASFEGAEVHLERVPMFDGDYDEGGAYWGGGGKPLFCAWDDDGNVAYFRAKDLEHARAKILEEAPGAEFTGPKSIKDYDWSGFARGAARAVWYSEYASEVDNSLEDRDDARKALSPGPGGDWTNTSPDPDKAALKDGKEFTKKFMRAVTPAELRAIAEKLDSGDAGWYAMMGALGHGVGLWDYGVDIEKRLRWEPTTALRNSIYDAINIELSNNGFETLF